MSQEPAAAPKRQARGQRRIEQIIAAAAEVFAEQGYEAASTNAIATRAGISPGSLYQFFPNKEAIARALADWYVVELGAAQRDALDPEQLASMPLASVVEQVVAPLVEFNLTHRGFKALFARADLPAVLTEATAPLNTALLARVEALLRSRSPALDTDDLRRTAMVSIQIVRAMTPLIVAAEPAERAGFVDELHRVLLGYLEPALG